MVALRLVEDLLGNHSVEVFKQSEYFPKTECNAMSLQFELEQLGVDSLIQEKVLRRHVFGVSKFLFRRHRGYINDIVIVLLSFPVQFLKECCLEGRKLLFLPV